MSLKYGLIISSFKIIFFSYKSSLNFFFFPKQILTAKEYLYKGSNWLGKE